MISINNTNLFEDEWGFYVDIESVIINDNDNYKHMSKKDFFSTLEDISEEYEYYYNQQKEEKNLCICVNCIKNVINMDSEKRTQQNGYSCCINITFSSMLTTSILFFFVFYII